VNEVTVPAGIALLPGWLAVKTIKLVDADAADELSQDVTVAIPAPDIESEVTYVADPGLFSARTKLAVAVLELVAVTPP